MRNFFERFIGSGFGENRQEQNKTQGTEYSRLGNNQKEETEPEAAAEKGTEDSLYSNLYSLETPSLEGVGELNKELSKYDFKPRLAFLFRLSENRASALEMIKSGKIDEKKVIDLVESKDFVERDAGLRILKKMQGVSREGIDRLNLLAGRDWEGEDKIIAEQLKVKILLETEKDGAFAELKKMTGDESWEKRKAAAEGLGCLGNEKAIPVLEKLCRYKMSKDSFEENSRRWDVMQSAAEARVKIILKFKSKKRLSCLRELIDRPDCSEVEKEAVKGLGTFGNIEAIDALRKINKEAFAAGTEEIKKASVQAIFSAMNNFSEAEGENAVPQLAKLYKDENKYIRQAAAKSWASIIIKIHGEKAGSVLEETFKSCDRETQDAVEFEKNKHKWLLATQKPMFATPYAGELAQKFLNLEKISKKIKEEFKDKFTGIIVYGSSVKGYFKKTDIDYKVIARDPEASKRLRALVDPEDYFESHGQINIDENYKIVDRDASDLFSGVFLGDRKEFTRIQKNFLESIGEKEWDWFRKHYADTGNLCKMAERFGISGDELEKIEQYIILLRTPPAYRETLKTVEKNLAHS